MQPRGLFNLTLATLLAGCSGEAGSPALMEAPTGAPESSEIVLQAVDAGTGAALADDDLTVRHLVRFPITMDESAVDEVLAAEPYHIKHDVAWDSLVVEVRLEAPSYHRLDTVLAVPRGGHVGPVTLRMARRLTAVANEQTTGRPSSMGAGSGRPSAAAADPDAGIDRTALRAGNRAFQQRNWVAATSAYESMPTPPRQQGTYAREYAEALVRKGEAHINLGEMAGALNALETATSYPEAGYQAFLLLGQVQCTVGRFDEGRESVREIERMAPRIPAAEWGTARALAAYQRAHCTNQEFQRVEAPLDILRVGGNAIDEYEEFIQEGEAMNPIPPEVSAAMDTARAQIEAIRARMRSGG